MFTHTYVEDMISNISAGERGNTESLFRKIIFLIRRSYGECSGEDSNYTKNTKWNVKLTIYYRMKTNVEETKVMRINDE